MMMIYDMFSILYQINIYSRLSPGDTTSSGKNKSHRFCRHAQGKCVDDFCTVISHSHRYQLSYM